MRLQNKVGIVTAAGSGMGRAGALRFAKEGAAVGVADIDQGRVEAVVGEINAAGGRALALAGDLRQDDFARDIVRQTARAFGGLDFVWNHVGHPGPAAIEGIDMADFELALDFEPAHRARDNRGGDPGIAGARRRRIALYRLDLGARRLAIQPGLFDGEIRRRRVCARARETPRARQHSRQRDLPRPDRHADAARLCRAAGPAAGTGRAGQGSADRQAGAAGAAAPHREARGDRERGIIPAVRRSLLRIGCGLAGRRRRDGVRGPASFPSPAVRERDQVRRR